MTTKLVTQPLKTGQVTLMSNVSSFTVTGRQISILEDQPKAGEQDCSAIHLTFDVENPQQVSSVLDTTEELCLIFNRDDAVKISLSLLSMAMDNRTPEDIEEIKSNLSKVIPQLA